MSEPTYTEAEIREAILWFNPSGGGVNTERVLDRLKRPKHDFAEGQVAYDPINEEYFQIASTEVLGLSDCRHLNMTELGPHVKALRDAVDDVDRHPGFHVRSSLRDALKAFDAAVGESK